MVKKLLLMLVVLNVASCHANGRPKIQVSTESKHLIDTTQNGDVCTEKNTCTDRISQFGITWFFDKQYRFGKFANGDYWVQTPNESVTIIKIDPPSEDVEGTILHGSMINPRARDANENFGSGLHVYQGFDSRLYNYDKDYNKGRPGGNLLSDRNPLVVRKDSSLVSSVSHLAEPNWATKSMALKTVAVLTVVKKAPVAHSFRPAYAGSDKRVKFNVSDIDYTRLASLSLTDAKLIDLHGDEDGLQGSSFERMVARPWLDFALDTAGSYMHPSENIASDGAMLSKQVSQIALILNTIHYSIEERKKLLIGFIQIGIDNFGIHDEENTEWRTWNANGQIGPGRKFPILFAGRVLNHPLAEPMLHLGKVSIGSVGYGGPGYISFAEDEQTFYVTAAPNSETDTQKRQIWVDESDQDYDIFVPNSDATPAYRRHVHAREEAYFGHANPGKSIDFEEYRAGTYVKGTEFDNGSGHEGMPEWGIIHTRKKSYDGLNWEAPYRSTNGTHWGGWILAAHAMGLKEYWGHDALFDYMDRFMDITGDQNPDWIRVMWEKHRFQ